MSKFTARFYSYESTLIQQYFPFISPSLFRSIFRFLRSKLLFATILRALQICLMFFPSFLLIGAFFCEHLVSTYAATYAMKLYLDWFNDPDGAMSHGIYLTIFYAFLFMAASSLQVHFVFRCFLAGYNLRSALVGLIFRKMLLFNTDSRIANGSGVLTNLVADNVQRLEVAVETIYTLLEVPLALLFSIVALTHYLDVSALLAIVVLAVLSPLSYFIARSTRKYKVKFLELADRRVKKTTEAVHGIKVSTVNAPIFHIISFILYCIYLSIYIYI